MTGSTPIQEAMKKEHSYIVKYLQEKGATLPNPIMGEVTDILIQKGVFNTSVINYEVTKFFTHLKMPEQYFKQFSVDEIATHIHSYIAAKKVAHSTSANRDDIWLVHETENEAYYVCTNGRDSIATMEEKIVKYLEATPKGKGYTLDVFTSAGTIGQKNLVIYSAKRGVTRERSERFKAVVEKAKSQMTPVIEVTKLIYILIQIFRNSLQTRMELFLLRLEFKIVQQIAIWEESQKLLIQFQE